VFVACLLFRKPFLQFALLSQPLIMSDEDSLKVRQDEELQVLRAIAGEDWTDVPTYKSAWGKEEAGWWKYALKACDDLVGVTIKGRLPKVRGFFDHNAEPCFDCCWR
jgi:hypothetical protein